MYSPSDIRHVAKRISDYENDLKSYENKFKGEVNGTGSWWKGGACTAFVLGYNETGAEFNKLYSHINELESGLKKLASDVQRADDEKKAKLEADKKRMQMQKAKNK